MMEVVEEVEEVEEVEGWKVSAEYSGPGVRYISTILTINIQTVKLFHVRTDRRTGL